MNKLDKLTNVVSLAQRAEKVHSEKRKPPTEPPDMELVERVANLETNMRDVRDRLLRVEIKLDSFATKEDMHREFNVQTWRIVGAILAAAGLVFAAVRLIP